MSKKFIYARKFFILKEDFTNIPDIGPKGHGLIKARENIGSISINIDRAEKESYYNLYLVGLDEGEIIEVFLGKIITDDIGMGVLEKKFNPRNIESSNYPINKFNAVVIRKGTKVLLTSYIDKDDGLLNNYIPNLDVKETKKNTQNLEVLDKELKQENIEEKETKEIEEIEEIEEETAKMEEIEKEVDENNEENKEEVDEKKEKDKEEDKVEEVGEDKEEDKEKDKVEEVDKVDKLDEEIDEIEEAEKSEETEKADEMKPIYNQKALEYMKRVNYKNQMSRYVLSILRFFPYVQPFKVKLEGYDWWEIQYDGISSNRGFLPFYNYLFNNYYTYPFMQNVATCHELIKKYGHYLFGMYSDKGEIKYYTYGIPGRFNSLEHPFRGITGFNTWYESEKDFGYWLMYINPLTGKVVYPLNPIIPPY